MKYFSLIILLFFFSSCRDNTKSREGKSISKKEIYEPVFLNFSPKMNESEFQFELNSEKLTHKQFVVELNEKTLAFNIVKMENRIVLHFSNVTDYDIDEINFDASLQKLLDNDNLINTLIEVFKEKYNQPITMESMELLKNSDELLNFQTYDGTIFRKIPQLNLSRDQYVFFQDSSKTIMIGYDKLGRALPNLSKELGNSSTVFEIEPTNEFNNYKQRFLERNKDYDFRIGQILNGSYSSQKFGLEIELNYLTNEDFDKVKNKIEKVTQTIDKEHKEQDSIYKKEKNIQIENLNNL